MKRRLELEEDQTARFREAALSGDFILASSKIHKQGMYTTYYIVWLMMKSWMLSYSPPPPFHPIFSFTVPKISS